MPDHVTKFPETFECDEYYASALDGFARNVPRTDWHEIAEYRLVRVRRIRFVLEEEK